MDVNIKIAEDIKTKIMESGISFNLAYFKCNKHSSIHMLCWGILFLYSSYLILTCTVKTDMFLYIILGISSFVNFDVHMTNYREVKELVIGDSTVK